MNTQYNQRRNQKKPVFEANTHLGSVRVEATGENLVIKVKAGTPEVEAELVSMVMACISDIEVQRAVRRLAHVTV